ncbi:hypothetical protein BS78_06G183100 [Paspalum vaginatum]|nr:hypothetical protein BS78_06G183100 [Paspalum vaginatum]
MASPPSPEPWKWIILSKVPRTANLQRNDISVSHVSPPPRLSYLTVSSTRIFPAGTQTQAAATNPRVLAADLSAGLFLIATNPRIFRVLDTASPTRTRVYGVLVDFYLDPASLGVISEPAGRGFRVVGFRYQLDQPGSRNQAWLRYYLPESLRTGRQATKAVNNPMPRHTWAFSNVIAHDGRLWWVDTGSASTAGLLFCDPFADSPRMYFVHLPDHVSDREYDDGDSGTFYRHQGFCSDCSGIPPAARRRVQVVDGKFRWVQMLCGHMEGSREGAPTVLELTINDPMAAESRAARSRGRCSIADRHSLSFADIWASDSYKETRLPRKEPAVAFIHPHNPFVVYFVLNGHLFGVDMLRKEVEAGCQPHGMPGPDVSAASSLIAWSPGRTRRPHQPS